MDNRIELRTSYYKNIKSTVFSSIPIFIGVSCLSSEMLIVDIIGVLNLMIGISGLAMVLYELLRNRPLVILSEDGVYDVRIMTGIISWTEISTAEIKKIRGNKTLVLTICKNLTSDRFKYLFRKTAKSQLRKKEIALNIDMLSVNHSRLQGVLDKKAMQ